MTMPFSRFIHKFVSVLFVVPAVLAFLAHGESWAKEKSVAEKVLDILKANNQITEEQYKELVAQAKEEERQGSSCNVFFKDGLNIEALDGKFKMKIGGRIETDFGTIGANTNLKEFGDKKGQSIEGNGAEFRRARLKAEGTIYDNIFYRAEYDFASGSAAFQDVYMGLKDIPYVGTFRVGHQKEPWSLEEQTSELFYTFMERSLANNAFSPVRNTGFMLYNNEFDERMYWGVGVFENTNNQGDTAGGIVDFSNWDVTARITGLPWYEDKGAKLVHLGLSYTHEFRDGSEDSQNPVRFRTRPESHLADLYTVDTGNINANGVDMIGPEFALVYGPFSLQAEYFQTWVDVGSTSNVREDSAFYGFYVFATYFLTGEHRPYNLAGGSFGRVRPFNNFSLKECGWGAWEAAVKYSQIDLTDSDSGVQGGREWDITAGLNWYLNPYARVMFNYVYANIDDEKDLTGTALANIFQTRFQVDF